MKKSLLILFMAVICMQSQGQIQSGRIFATGFGSINSVSGKTDLSPGGSEDQDKIFSGTFGLGGGYLLSDHIAVGLGLGFTGMKITPEDNDDPIMRSRSFTPTLFGRYYVPLSEKLYFHGTLSFQYGMGKVIAELDGDETEMLKTRSFRVGASPGLAFFPSDRIAMDMTFGFLGFNQNKSFSNDTNPEVEVTENEFIASFDLTTVNFGLFYFFN